MTVFKGYMLLFKRNIGFAIMYFAIFLGIVVIITQSAEKENTKKFVEAKAAVSVVELDNSLLSKELVSYLQKKHAADVEKNDDSLLYEQLYYGKKGVVLKIQENFQEKAFKGEAGICLTNAPGSYQGIYLQQQVNLYVSNVVSYCEAGYSIEEACQRVEAQKESRISIEDVNGNAGKISMYVTFLQYLPYLFLSVFTSVLAKMLYEARRRNVKNRVLASSVSLIRQNIESILAFAVIGTGIYLFIMLIAALLYGREVFLSQNGVWYLLNTFADMLVTLVIAFIVGIFVRSVLQVSTISVPLSLGLSFICGVFVPLEVMGTQIKNVAKFLPIYWYEVVNGILAEHAAPEGDLLKQVVSGIGIQFLFAAALIGFAMAVLKYQQQE